MFELAKKWIPKLYLAKENEGVSRKVPQFVHIRRQLYDKKVPNVNLEVAYLDKSSDETIVLKNIDKIPSTSTYPPDKFIKLYEVASVKVNNFVCVFIRK